jgi:hypothetical protein
MDLLITAIGWLGAGLLLLAYGLVSAGRLRTEAASFQTLNLAGAAALVVNSAYHGALPSAALNLAWISIGLVAMTRRTPTDPSADSGGAGSGSAGRAEVAGGVGQRADQQAGSGLRP